MTALPGSGALPGTDGTPGAAAPPLEEPPEDGGEDSELGVSLSCWANGSLLVNRLKDACWPSCTVTVVAVRELAEPAEPVVGPVSWAPPSVGAASVGVPPAGVVVVDGCAAAGAGVFIIFMTRGTWKAITPRKATPSTAAMIFCFFCFAFSASTFFFAIRELLSPTRR